MEREWSPPALIAIERSAHVIISSEIVSSFANHSMVLLLYSCLTLLTLYRKTESAFSKWRGSGHVFFIKICEGYGHHSPTNKISGGRFVYGSSWRLMKEVSIPSRLRWALRKWPFSIKIRVGGGHFQEDKWPLPLQSEKWMVCVLMCYYTQKSKEIKRATWHGGHPTERVRMEWEWSPISMERQRPC